jgi:hypothetical protein
MITTGGAVLRRLFCWSAGVLSVVMNANEFIRTAQLDIGSE